MSIPNRTLCDVLTEMRKCTETLNFSYIKSLIEEAQTMGNRMEAALWDQNDLKRIRDDIKKSKEERDNLKEEIRKLESNKKTLSS